MAERFQVDAPNGLLSFLITACPGMSRAALKKRLKNGAVVVNGKTQTAFDYPLMKGDDVGFGKAGPVDRRALTSLYEDAHYIAIDKPAGVLSVAAKTTGEDTVLSRVRAQFLGGGRCWPAHRIDRETSGVLVLSKSREANDALQSQWSTVEKEYIAITETTPKPPQGTVRTLLHEDKRLNVRVGPGPDAKDAVTHYVVEETSGGRAFVRVKIDTGRKHQIRVHLAHVGAPLRGDIRYGKKGPRLGLHAHRLSFTHPVSGARVELVSPVPRSITTLLGGK